MKTTSYVAAVEYVNAASVSVICVADIKRIMSHTPARDANVAETSIVAVRPLTIL